MLHGQLKHRYRRPDAGETLIEVLLAVVIIALSVSALLGGLITSITSSAEHRSLAELDTVLKSNADSLKYQVELMQPDTSAWFTDCASVAATSYGSHTVIFSVPSGYIVQLTGIQYWNSSTDQFDATSVDSTSCLANPSDQTGYQLLTLTGTAPNGVSQTLRLGVRKPA